MVAGETWVKADKKVRLYSPLSMHISTINRSAERNRNPEICVQKFKKKNPCVTG